MAKINNPLIVLKGKDEQTKTVDLAMADGNQSITPDSGKTLSGVTVTKPATMLPANIKKDVNIGGVVGTLEEGIDISDTTATAADVRVGKNFYVANGTKTQGTITDYDNSSEVVEGISNTGVTLPETLVNGEDAGAAVGNKIYLFNDKKTIQEFNTETKTITTLSNVLSTATDGIGCAAVGTKIYLLGGSVGFNKLNTIQEFDTETKTIQTLSATLSTAAENMGCAAVGSKIYLFGGLGSQPLNTIQEFDTETNTIQTLSATLPTATYNIRATAVGTKIYLFGGTTANTKLNSIKEFDAETKTITTLSVTLPAATANMGCAAVGTKIYLFGGYSTKRLNTIQEFDTESKTLKTASITLPIATTSIVAVTVGNKIYLISGYSDSGWVEAIYEFSPNGAVVDIFISDKNGVVLNAKSKYCLKDITVKPTLQAKTATANGDISPDDGYCGLEKVTISVPATPTQEKTVDLAMASGNQVVEPDTGKVLSKVTITKPSTLIPTNIKSGVNIGGVLGTYDPQPTLQTKTVTPTKSQQTITPDSNYDGLSQVTVNAIPDDYIMPSGSQTITANGTYDITSKASVVVNVPSSQPTLNAPTISLTDSTLKITNPASNGNFVTKFKVFSNGTALTEATIKGSTTNVDLSTLLTTGGTYTITAKASAANFNDSAASNSVSYEVKTQTTPVISLVSGTTIQIDTIDENATTIEVYADGTKIGEVAKQ